MQVSWRLESGEHQVDTGRALDLATSTIRTILKNAEKIKTFAKSTTTKLTIRWRRRNDYKAYEWKIRLSACHMPVSQLLVMEKAKRIFNHLQEQGEEPTTETFGASRGWFDRFKHRSNLHSKTVSGEAASADHRAALELPDTFKAVIKHGNCPPSLSSMWVKPAFIGSACYHALS
jgi:hypothetical protein